MKKILIILGTEFSALQMFTHLQKNQNKYIVDLLIQKDLKNDLLKIFKKNLRKIFFVITPPPPVFFRILKFWNIFHRNKNRVIYKKIYDSLANDNFNLNDYDEVFFSNELISSYILYNSRIKKTYFDHSPIDVLLNLKLDFFTNIKVFVDCFVNNKLMYVYVKCRGNFLHKSFFANFLIKKNKKKLLSKKIFRKFFYKYNKKNIKKNLNCHYNLINFSIPYSVDNVKYTDFLIQNYINFFFKNILVKIFEKKNTQKDIYLIKFRTYIPLKFQLYIISLIKKKFPDKKTILVNKTFPTLKTLESVIVNFNIKKYFTTFSSSIYFSKILNKQILIYDYTSISRVFWKQNWVNLKTKNNYKNYPLAIKLYKNYSHKL